MAVTIPSLRPAPAAPHESRGRRLIDYWPLAPVLLGVALLALPTLAYPFGPDQAIFATIGDAINRGHMPYVDAWDQKPPAIYLWYALALRLPGDLMARVRLLDAVWTVATIVLLYELARSMWSVRAATFAALLYGVIYFTTQGWWYLAQPDGLIGLPLLLAFLLYRRAVGPRRWAFCLAAGALAGIAFQLRFIVAPMLPLFALTDLWERRDAIRRVVERVLWLSLGFALVQAALIAYLAAGDALREYLAATQFASGYVSTGWPYAPAKRTFVGYLHYARDAGMFWLGSHNLLALPAIAGAFTAAFLRPEPRVRQITLMALVGLAGIGAQQKFFWYHWQLLLPLLALLAGWSWDTAYGALEAWAGRTPRALAGKVVLTGGLILLSPSVMNYAYAQWDSHLHRHDTAVAWVRWANQFGGYGEGAFSYLADVQVAEYLRERTAPSDTVYVFGYDPLVYLLSGRQSASRFIYSLPFMSSWAPKRWLDEFSAELERNRPAYFLVQKNEGAATWITGQSEDTAAWVWKLSPVRGRLEREYVEEAEIEDFTIYRRMDHAPSAPRQRPEGGADGP